jgi:hypothetical protein
MAVQSIAQPVQVSPYKVAPIDLSDSTAISLFYYYGTEATAPELIKWSGRTGS